MRSGLFLYKSFASRRIQGSCGVGVGITVMRRIASARVCDGGAPDIPKRRGLHRTRVLHPLAPRPERTDRERARRQHGRVR